ncbi:MAG: DUF4330 domain-containing protein [Candidatus Gastranaerophilaceae bacterium]
MKTPFENFKKADCIIILGVVVILLAAVLTMFGLNKNLSKSPILEEKDIAFTVFFRGVTTTDTVSPFVPGENTFITIRNVPYKKLKITDVRFDRRKILLETAKKGEYEPVDDISHPFVYDFTVTLQDKAKITEDGAVVGGNKVKMGIPVILEGQKYKYTGVISNVQFIEQKKQTEVQAEETQIQEQPQTQEQQKTSNK